MRLYARIDTGRVAEIFDLNEHFPDRDGIDGLFHPSLDWRPAPAGCVEGWVVNNGQIVPPDYYQVLREAEYPPMAQYLDSMVKKASADAAVQAAGDKQLADYLNGCLAVKLKYPKPATI